MDREQLDEAIAELKADLDGSIRDTAIRLSIDSHSLPDDADDRQRRSVDRARVATARQLEDEIRAELRRHFGG